MPILLSDEELCQFIEFPVEGFTSDRKGVAKAQLKKVAEELYHKSIWARIKGKTGRFITEDEWQTLKKEAGLIRETADASQAQEEER